MLATRVMYYLPLFLCSVYFTWIVVSISTTDLQMLNEPLSNFRFGRWAFHGTLAFFLLIVVGLLYIAIAFQFAERGVQFVALFASILIIFVSVTPSYHAGHELAANGLMILLFGFYGVRLSRASSFWLFAHVLAPIAILATIASISHVNFGTVQKSFIVYLVFLVNVDSLVLLGVSFSPEWQSRVSAKKKTVKVRIPTPRVIYRKNRWDRLLEGSRT